MHSDSQTALVGELKSALGAQTPLSANLSSLLGSLNSTIKSQSLLIDKLILELAILKRLRFGQSSESSKQIELFGEADSELIIQPAPDPRLELLTPKIKLKSTERGLRVPTNLPVERVVINLAEADRCDADGGPLKCIGEDVSRKLAIKPGYFFWLDTVICKYADPSDPDAGIKSAPLPPQILPGGERLDDRGRLLAQAALRAVAHRAANRTQHPC